MAGFYAGQASAAALDNATAEPEDVLRIATAALPAAPVAMDWTQAGDGVLIADAGGSVTMWQLRRDAPASDKTAKSANAAAKPAAEAAPALSVAWHVNAKQRQVIMTRRVADTQRCSSSAGCHSSGVGALTAACCPGILLLCAARRSSRRVAVRLTVAVSFHCKLSTA